MIMKKYFIILNSILQQSHPIACLQSSNVYGRMIKNIDMYFLSKFSSICMTMMINQFVKKACFLFGWCINSTY